MNSNCNTDDNDDGDGEFDWTPETVGKAVPYDEQDEKTDPTWECRFSSQQIVDMTDRELEELMEDEITFLHLAYGIEAEFDVDFFCKPRREREKMVRAAARRYLQQIASHVNRQEQAKPSGTIQGVEPGTPRRQQVLQLAAVVVFLGGRATERQQVRYSFFNMAPPGFIKCNPFDFDTAKNWVRECRKDLIRAGWLIDLRERPPASKFGKVPAEFLDELDRYVEMLEKQYPRIDLRSTSQFLGFLR